MTFLSLQHEVGPCEWEMFDWIGETKFSMWRQSGKVEILWASCLSEACKTKFNVGQQRTKGTIYHVRVDLWRPSKTPTQFGARYFMSIVDYYSQKLWIYNQKTKDESFENFKD